MLIRSAPPLMPLMRVSAVVGLVFGLATAGCGDDDDDVGALAADAGEDITVAVGESPTFDGCGSTGDITNYRWTILEAPEAMADDAGKVIAESAPDCAFTLEAAMLAEEAGTWVIELAVTDAGGAERTDTVTVVVGDA